MSRNSLGVWLTMVVAVLVGLGGCDKPAGTTTSSEAENLTPPPPTNPGGASAAANPGGQAAARPQRPMPPADAPSLLLISIDTLRADHLGCYGHPAAATPNLDRLASEGIRFSNCVASSPITLPSHATMLTGSYPFVHGARSNARFRLNDENETLPEMLRAKGYVTWAEVAATVLNRETGMAQGFDMYRGPGGLPGDPRERRADEVTDAALELVARSTARPFFGFVHYFDPHAPYAAPEPFGSQYEDPYVAEIAYVDAQVGRLLDGLAQSPRGDNTIVVVTSDHGEGRGQHGEGTHSFFLYDTTQRVPLIIWRPGRWAAEVDEAQARLIDLAPTMAQFMGLERTAQMQGRDLLSRAGGMNPPAYAETLEPHLSLEFSTLRALWHDGWKYIHAPNPLLFHVAEDPGEERNLAASEPQRVDAMRSRLREVMNDAPQRVSTAAAQRNVDAAQLRDLAALGYAGSDEAELDENVLDQFDPSGADPHREQRTLYALAQAIGHLQVRRFDEAVQELGVMLEDRPDNAVLLRNYADALEGAGRRADALAAYQRLLAARPKTTTARLQMAKLQARMGQADDAIKTLQELLEIAPDIPAAYVDLANLLVANGRHAEVNQVLQQAHERIPNNYEIQLATVRLMAVTGNQEMAQQVIGQLIQRQPARFDAYQLMAEMQIAQGNAAGAVQTLGRYHQRYPNVRRAVEPLVRALLAAKQPQQAAALWERNIDKFPASGRRRVQYAVALRRSGQPNEALAQFSQAAELDPRLGAAWLGVAQISEQQGDSDRALTAYIRLMELSRAGVVGPQLAAQAFLGASSLQMAAGQVAAAAEALREGVERVPQSPRLLEARAWLLATCEDSSIRDCAEAKQLAERLVNGAQPTLSIADTHAAAVACGGDYDGAVALLEQALAGLGNGVPEAFQAQVRARIALYQTGQPFVEKIAP